MNMNSKAAVRTVKRTRRGGRKHARRRRAALQREREARWKAAACGAAAALEGAYESTLEQQILTWVGAVHTAGTGVAVSEPPEVCTIRARRALRTLHMSGLRDSRQVADRIECLRGMRRALRALMADIADGDSASMDCLHSQHLRFLRQICALKTALDYAAHGRLLTAGHSDAV